MRFFSGIAAGALVATAAITLPACSGSGYVSSGSAISTGTHYQVRGRYYHCHPNGMCHSVHHANYYFVGGRYIPRSGHYYQRPGYNRPHYNRPSHYRQPQHQPPQIRPPQGRQR